MMTKQMDEVFELEEDLDNELKKFDILMDPNINDEEIVDIFQDFSPSGSPRSITNNMGSFYLKLDAEIEEINRSIEMALVDEECHGHVIDDTYDSDMEEDSNVEEELQGKAVAQLSTMMYVYDQLAQKTPDEEGFIAIPRPQSTQSICPAYLEHYRSKSNRVRKATPPECVNLERNTSTPESTTAHHRASTWDEPISSSTGQQYSSDHLPTMQEREKKPGPLFQHQNDGQPRRGSSAGRRSSPNFRPNFLHSLRNQWPRDGQNPPPPSNHSNLLHSTSRSINRRSSSSSSSNGKPPRSPKDFLGVPQRSMHPSQTSGNLEPDLKSNAAKSKSPTFWDHRWGKHGTGEGLNEIAGQFPHHRWRMAFKHAAQAVLLATRASKLMKERRKNWKHYIPDGNSGTNENAGNMDDVYGEKRHRLQKSLTRLEALMDDFGSNAKRLDDTPSNQSSNAISNAQVPSTSTNSKFGPKASQNYLPQLQNEIDDFLQDTPEITPDTADSRHWKETKDAKFSEPPHAAPISNGLDPQAFQSVKMPAAGVELNQSAPSTSLPLVEEKRVIASNNLPRLPPKKDDTRPSFAYKPLDRCGASPGLNIVKTSTEAVKQVPGPKSRMKIFVSSTVGSYSDLESTDMPGRSLCDESGYEPDNNHGIHWKIATPRVCPADSIPCAQLTGATPSCEEAVYARIKSELGSMFKATGQMPKLQFLVENCDESRRHLQGGSDRAKSAESRNRTKGKLTPKRSLRKSSQLSISSTKSYKSSRVNQLRSLSAMERGNVTPRKRRNNGPHYAGWDECATSELQRRGGISPLHQRPNQCSRPKSYSRPSSRSRSRSRVRRSRSTLQPHHQTGPVVARKKRAAKVRKDFIMFLHDYWIFVVGLVLIIGIFALNLLVSNLGTCGGHSLGSDEGIQCALSQTELGIS